MLKPEIMALFMPIASFIAIAFIIKIISDNRTRRVAIEKGMLNENLKYLYYDRFEHHLPSALKWGIILIAVGSAIFVGRMFPYDIMEEVTIGTMLIFAGCGLILYYYIANRMVKKNKVDNME